MRKSLQCAKCNELREPFGIPSYCWHRVASPAIADAHYPEVSTSNPLTSEKLGRLNQETALERKAKVGHNKNTHSLDAITRRLVKARSLSITLDDGMQCSAKGQSLGFFFCATVWVELAGSRGFGLNYRRVSGGGWPRNLKLSAPLSNNLVQRCQLTLQTE